MATQATAVASMNARAGSFAYIADRWIYVFMAAVFFVTVLAGFIPDSLAMLDAVAAGQRPPLPPVLHFHAVMMGLWMSLLLVQTLAMATGNRRAHMQLGLTSVVVAPLVVASMVAVVSNGFTMLASMATDAIPTDVINGRRSAASNLLLEQIRLVLVFAVCITWAMLVRRTAPEVHKRLVFFATLMPLPAAFNRIAWLPTTLPESPLSNHLFLLAWLAPLLVYDIWRRGRLHKAYLVAIAASLPLIAAEYVLWGTDWWLETAPRLFGIDSW